MLDTHARTWVDPIIIKIAQIFINKKWTPNQVTKLAFVVGIFAGIFVGLKLELMAVLLLWSSGLLDAVDGEIARRTKQSSAWGTLMDITFDRIVEISVLLGLAYRDENVVFELLLVAVAIIISMTIFLTVGALSEKQGKKSFYYQAGVMERTEGFILFTAMICFKNQTEIIAIIFAALIFITAIQRLVEAKRIL